MPKTEILQTEVRSTKNLESTSKDENNTNYIFRPYIKRNGKTYYAKTYGLKAFRIPISK